MNDGRRMSVKLDTGPAKERTSVLAAFIVILALGSVWFYFDGASDINSGRCAYYQSGQYIFETFPACIQDLNQMVASIVVTMVCLPLTALKFYIDRRRNWDLYLPVVVLILVLALYAYSWHFYGTLLPNLTGPNQP